MKLFEKYFDDFIGYLIILNVLHQIFISGYSLSGNLLFLSQNFILFSFVVFIFESIFRILKERKLSILLLIDIVVITNYLFINILDLRIFRIFRAYSIFSQLKSSFTNKYSVKNYMETETFYSRYSNCCLFFAFDFFCNYSFS